MDANEGARRRLPAWMLGGQAGNVNGGDEVKEGNENEEKVGKPARKAKPKVQKEVKKKGKASLKQPSVIVRRQLRKGGKREVTPDDDDDEISLDDEFHEEAPRERRKSRSKDKACLQIETDEDFELGLKDDEFRDEAPKEKRKSRKKVKTSSEIETDKDFEIGLEDDEFHEEAPRKKRSSRKKNNTCLETETAKDVEGDGEAEDLTVEDLVSIAKEYVEQDDKKVAGNQSRDTNMGSFENPGASSSSMAENLTTDTGLKPAVTSSTSMLELMLGPLYKKHSEQEKEKKLDLGYSSFKYEEIKQPSAEVVAEPSVAMPKKKKSSLKDMVAMYLD